MIDNKVVWLYSDQDWCDVRQAFSWMKMGLGRSGQAYKEFKAGDRWTLIVEGVEFRFAPIPQELKAEREKARLEVIRSMLSEETLQLIGDCGDLEKAFAWQEDYMSYVTWAKFEDDYHYCDGCESYEEGQCMCYSR
jgi:hypothetical protein